MNPKVDLETYIHAVWQTSDDLKLLYEHHGDHPVPMSDDDVANAIWGIKVLHDMRMEKLFDMYTQKFELDQYCTDPVKLAAREKLGFPIQKKGKKK